MTQEEFQQAVLSKFDKIETDIQEVKTELKEVKTEIKEMKKFQQSSLYEVVQYINERTERTENKLDVLNARLFNQEAEIQGLRRIK